MCLSGGTGIVGTPPNPRRTVTTTQAKKQTQPANNTNPTDNTTSAEYIRNALASANLALEAALDKKALEPVLLDVHELCSYTAYLLLISGRSDRQVDAIADGIREQMAKNHNLRPLGVEGTGSGQWALLDYGDIVVHVFYHPAREYYDLEGLWSDAPRVPIDVPDEARATAEDRY